MIDCLSTLKDNMPPSINSGINALYQLQDHEPNKGRSFAGGVTMSGNSIKMSSRLLGEILAGRISQEEIGAFHSATRQRPNIFEVFRRRGQTIEGVVIERQDDADDDWITFAFSEGQDPAISKFVAKPKRLDDSESPSE